MKKLFFFFILPVFFITGCSGGGNTNDVKPEIGKQQVANNNEKTTVKASDGDEISKKIIGEWEAETLGDILSQYGYSLPAKFTFNSDGTYIWEYARSGASTAAKGKYIIVDTSSTPFKIDFEQSHIKYEGKWVTDAKGKTAKIPYSGIFELNGDGKLITVFYEKEFVPRPEEFDDSSTQIYRKVK
ncbi:MAG TPA: hypothetical protein DHW82_12840 [Spirochaetia bacterium]|nr:MAG: hypothetical protein A2Y41_03300 [Spirochaetes bacterium GWB1_36_13]HCL57876.1 hypothetical protein [Spirochaetia bacterium]